MREPCWEDSVCVFMVAVGVEWSGDGEGGGGRGVDYHLKGRESSHHHPPTSLLKRLPRICMWASGGAMGCRRTVPKSLVSHWTG